MCGRFALSKADRKRLEAQFGAVEPPVVADAYNIAPTQPVWAISQRGNERVMRQHRFGLVPSWAKDMKISSSLINARSETIFEKPAFRKAVATRRCVIPASGFYEWRKPDKQPFYFYPEDEQLFAFAGIWESWRPEKDAEPMLSCSIVTGAASNDIAPIHDRMPLLLTRDTLDLWLGEGFSPGDMPAVVAAAQAMPVASHTVSRAVNKAGQGGAELIVNSALPCSLWWTAIISMPAVSG